MRVHKKGIGKKMLTSRSCEVLTITYIELWVAFGRVSALGEIVVYAARSPRSSRPGVDLLRLDGRRAASPFALFLVLLFLWSSGPCLRP